MARRGSAGGLKVVTTSSLPSRLIASLTSRRGARISALVALLALVALIGVLGRAPEPPLAGTAPVNSESMRVSELLERFPGSDRQAVLVVATRADGAALTQGDLAALADLQPRIAVTETTGATPPPMVSDDGIAAVLTTTITVGEDAAATSEVIKHLRATIAEHQPAGLVLQVTGGPAFGADVAAAFDGADFTLLLVTITVVAVLLIVTYRSPVLWLLPLLVVGLADQAAGKAAAALGGVLDLSFDVGIISVLVFGAGANYALLLISRYREELLVEADHRLALRRAWLGAAPAIIASNLTVVLALSTLAFAVTPGTQGLGLTSAVGLLIAAAAVLFALPPVLALCGRRVFWPFVPRVTAEQAATADAAHPDSDGRDRRGFWYGVGSRVVGRPVAALLGGLVLLGVMASGLAGTTTGLTELEKFRVPSESAAGLVVLSEHFPPGEAQPTMIVANSAAADQVAEAAKAVPGVVRVTVMGRTDDGTLARIAVVGEPAPGTAESLDLVTQLRTAVHGVPGADALVGGAVAADLDARAGNLRDLQLIAPLIVAVSALVLLVLLRSVIAPALLILVNLASAAAAIGAGGWLAERLFAQSALDLPVPLLSFLFLVALGIDYIIFLVHRARAEAAVPGVGTRRGMIEAVARTGGVITSAGIVLAAVFAALGVLPLVALGQLGLIVGLGVVVDTIIVRTVVVPALFALLGDRMWWPGKVAAHHAPDAAQSRSGVAGAGQVGHAASID